MLVFQFRGWTPSCRPLWALWKNGPMAETRTKEQIDADDGMEAAIQRVADAYGMDDTGQGFMLGEFLIVCTWPSIADDNATYHWFVNGRAMPRHHVLGLYRMLGMMLNMEFERPGEEE